MSTPLGLRASNLSSIAGRVRVPHYDRDGLTAGIVHVGVGAFHRSHQAAYLDDLLERGLARDFALCGLGVLDSDVDQLTALAAQDCLYVLALRHPDGRWDGRLIGSITRVLHAKTHVEAAIEALAAPTTRIVSLTITEGGYNLTPDGAFDLSDPAVSRELAAAGPPRTVFGLVTAALARRRERGLLPFIVMSCDNIEGNGHVARSAFLSYASAVDRGLAEWLERQGAFPSSMVDRITPATTDGVRRQVADRFGVRDDVPVTAEPFTQWVLEDDFPLGRPEYEHVGVQMVSDVRPFELMKLRLLNGSHQAIGYLGSLLGYTFVHEAVQDPEVAGFVRAYMGQEAAQTLPHVPDTDLDAYQAELMRRFSNPEIADTLARLAAYPSDRMPKFVLPVLLDLVRAGRDLRLGAAIVSACAVFCLGHDERGRALKLTDHRAEALRSAAAAAKGSPPAFLDLPMIPSEVCASPDFVSAYLDAWQLLAAGGVRELLAGLPTIGT